MELPGHPVTLAGEADCSFYLGNTAAHLLVQRQRQISIKGTIIMQKESCNHVLLCFYISLKINYDLADYIYDQTHCMNT